MSNLRTNAWENSYSRKENFIFYPKEEVIKFLSRHIKKRVGLNEFIPVLKSNSKLKGLDLGCGIGRQTILFEEFNIEGYGADISSVALKEADKLANFFGYDLTGRFVKLTELALPFDNNFFDFAIADSVLDSMNFGFAQKYMKELNRTVKHFVYLNVICGDSVNSNFSEDVEVTSVHESGTIQSYYTIEKLKQLIINTDFNIHSLQKIAIESLNNQSKNVRFHVVLKK